MEDPGQTKVWKATTIDEGPWIDHRRHASYSLLTAWSAVFFVNLPLCLFLGCFATQGGARAGMILGIALLFALGAWACISARFVGRALTIGGIPVGLAQFYPIPHLYIGSAGLGVANALEKLTVASPVRPHPECVTSVGGLAATLFTGGLLMTVAFLFGIMLPAILPQRWRKDSPKAARPVGPKMTPADLRDF